MKSSLNLNFHGLRSVAIGTLAAFAFLTSSAIAESTGEKIVSSIFAEGRDQITIIESLAETGDPYVETVLEAWKRGEVFIYEAEGSDEKTPFMLEDPESETASPAIRSDNQEALTDASGAALSFLSSDLEPVDTSSLLRRAMKTTTDLLALGAPDAETRAEAARKLGLMQRGPYVPILEARLETETDPAVKEALEEGLAITYLLVGDREQILTSVKTLGEIKSIAGIDYLNDLINYQEGAGDSKDQEIIDAATLSLNKINAYLSLVDFWGTCFRGLSLGSVLLIVALGLAITFGLMGVINMAHGELIAVGAYATYLTEVVFTSWFGDSGLGFELYFVFALPVSFLAAALLGLVLERGVIQFLYKRPLESLLATWGVSLILQQVFRLIFGAANRQVNSPRWLMGSFEIADVTLNYNRLFVIGFAVLIVIGTWLLMTRTPLGLCIRAVMQNRDMAASMGIRTARVRTLTFCFGAGLAGLAGAFLSQIGNVGPSLGQSYIVDSFMVVVAGGVGNIIGTVISALGIGVGDQVLQPTLGPVMGKICVLVAIILFLQWRPGGLFPARSRSLEG